MKCYSYKAACLKCSSNYTSTAGFAMAMGTKSFAGQCRSPATGRQRTWSPLPCRIQPLRRPSQLPIPPLAGEWVLTAWVPGPSFWGQFHLFEQVLASAIVLVQPDLNGSGLEPGQRNAPAGIFHHAQQAHHWPALGELEN